MGFASFGPKSDTKLSTQQAAAMAHVGSGKNLFLTGPGGTGKSFFITRLTSLAREAGNVVGVTAFTGTAASHLQDGQTLHSWVGLGLASGDLSGLARRLKRSPKLVERYRSHDVLVIDEVCMVEMEFLSKIDNLLRMTRGSDVPFGGIVVVLCGDFCQLPPIRKGGDTPTHLFESREWIDWVPAACYLTRSFRQDNKSQFDLLCRLRLGDASDLSDRLAGQVVADDFDPGPQYTRLFSTHEQVKARNSACLRKLMASSGNPSRNGLVHCQLARRDGKPVSADDAKRYSAFAAKLSVPDVTRAARYVKLSGMPRDNNGFLNALDKLVKKLNNSMGVLTTVVGARIMITINFCQEKGLFNGAQATVIGYCTEDAFPLTFDEMLTSKKDLGDGARAAVVEELSCLPAMAADGQFNPVIELMGGRQMVLPRSLVANEAQLRIRKTAARNSASTMIGPRFTCYQARLAYALTIHKAQGHTLHHVAVSARNIFERGQLYVALSRIVNLDNLLLFGTPQEIYDAFRPDRVHCDPRVKLMYECMAAVTAASPDAIVPMRAVFDAMRAAQ